jgi:uncharacterized protein
VGRLVVGCLAAIALLLAVAASIDCHQTSKYDHEDVKCRMRGLRLVCYSDSIRSCKCERED